MIDYLQMMVHWSDADWVTNAEAGKTIRNLAIFELSAEKDIENDNQSGEIQVSETEHWGRYSFVRMA